MTYLYKKGSNHHFLYDPSIINDIDPSLFDPGEWIRNDAVIGEVSGRGKTLFVSNGDHSYVLRHYRRGGMIAKLISDHYFWLGLSRTRAWREWHLLNRMYQDGLPVPRPVAANILQRGWRYCADLLTIFLPDCKTLANCLRKESLRKEVWRGIGKCIRRFHDAGICHADLNAHNILLSGEGIVYLVDFDKGSRRSGADGWKNANLSRLHRSLLKITNKRSVSSFSDENWQAFLRGYRYFDRNAR